MCVDSVGVVCVRTVKVLLLEVGVYYRTGSEAQFVKIALGTVLPNFSESQWAWENTWLP